MTQFKHVTMCETVASVQDVLEFNFSEGRSKEF